VDSGVITMPPILVGGCKHLETYESQWEGLSHILWNYGNKNMFETTNQNQYEALA